MTHERMFAILVTGDRMSVVVHVDLDAFYASVEQLDNPSLRGKPVIVGGLGKRSVVPTCSYEARRYGVRSAMPVFKAQKLCPQGIFVSGRFRRYIEMSGKVFGILRRYSDKIEPLSIDEAFLDFSGYENPREVLAQMKQAVYAETGLTISAGISYNKFLAKLASEWEKPNGLVEIKRSDVPEILKDLKVSHVYGLGGQSVARLNRTGIFTIGDLLKYSREFLSEYIGSYGADIYDMIRGNDTREIRPNQTVKSIGKETTLPEDSLDKEYLCDVIMPFCQEIEARLNRREYQAFTVTLKYKTASFQGHTRSQTLHLPVSTATEIYGISENLLKGITLSEPVRLIGVSVSNFQSKKERQLDFFSG